MFSFLKRSRKSKVLKLGIERHNDTNVIDKDLQSILKPLNLMQALFLSPKYKIRDDVIIKTNLNLYSLVIIVAISITHLYCFSKDLSLMNLTIFSFALKISSVLNAFKVFFGVLLNFYINCYHRDDNVRFILKLQNAFRILKIDSSKFIKNNWFAILFLNCFYFLWLMSYSHQSGFFRWWKIITLFSVMLFDFNVLHASRLLSLLRRLLQTWIEEVNSSGYIRESDNEANWIRRFNVFMDILKAYRLFDKTFKVLVSNKLFKVKKHVHL